MRCRCTRTVASSRSELRDVVPFVRLQPAVVAALERDGIVAEFVDTSARDSYWRLLADLWAEGGSFVVLEQDKVPSPGLLRELWDCSRPWCSTPVGMRGVDQPAPYPSLACTKFDASLMAADPFLLEKAGSLDLGFGERDWSRLDLAVAGLLGSVAECHWHEGGRVEHRHE
jgi:hypothetical protein